MSLNHLPLLPLLFLIAFLAILALAQGMWGLILSLGSTQSRVRRRLEQISAGDTRAEMLRRRMLGENMSPWLAKLLESAPIRWFDRLVLTSGVTLPTEYVLFLMIVSFTPLLGMSGLAGLRPPLCVAIALAGSVGLPLSLLVLLRRRRLDKMVLQLPEAIDVLVRSLRAGHPVPTGVRMIAAEMADPIRTEFRLAADIMTYGLDMKSAFERMERRIPLQEFRYMAAAIRIQYETGGNLAEILGSLADVMRERLKLKLKVKALSAEARLSGKILALVPFAITGFVDFYNPDYYSEAAHNPALVALLGVAAILVVAGILMIRRLAQIEA
jgi:tight adherence protein B